MGRDLRSPFRWALLGALVIAAPLGCDSSSGGSVSGKGGSNGTGGASASGGSASGGNKASGGSVGSGGSVSSGGSVGVGGSAPAGGSVGNGGAIGSGGAAAGGSGAGGARTGGANGSGGSASGGSSANPDGGPTDSGRDSSSGTGGRATGGSSSAGGTVGSGGAVSSGGSAAGGSTGAGGSTNCTFPDPPSNVSAWINESWNSQLSSNVKTRKDWLLDSIMMGKGQINLCVRWGATSAPTATVKSGMAAAVQKWLTDWLSNLDGYGCFPYPAPVAKVTGWAVKPGNTSWVSDLDSSIKVYTETDADGEPKCPDACSFFDNWSHTFPSCPGGEAFHTDYWLWLDDNLPGGGGAAAVGGDWGLRMPVSNFTASMGKSNLVIEHEMGHGFGFQDYYDWTGSTPAGGSLMIVGSTSSQTPTVGDQWLLRRTWKEMKTLRGW